MRRGTGRNNKHSAKGVPHVKTFCELIDEGGIRAALNIF
jgi:hypothetical protein